MTIHIIDFNKKDAGFKREGLIVRIAIEKRWPRERIKGAAFVKLVRGMSVDRRGYDLSTLDLTNMLVVDATIPACEIHNSDLNNAAFRNVKMAGVEFHACQTQHLYFEKVTGRRFGVYSCKIDFVQFKDCKLPNASFDYSQIRRAQLINTNFDDAGYYNVMGGSDFFREFGVLHLSGFGQTWPVYMTKTHMQIGCERHRIKKWWNFLMPEIYQMSGTAAEDFWRKNKSTLQLLHKANFGKANHD